MSQEKKTYTRSAQPGQPPLETKPKKPKRGLHMAAIISISLVIALLGGLYMGYNRLSDELIEKESPAGSLPQAVTTDKLPEYTGKGIITGLVCGIDYDNEDANGYTTKDKIGNTDMIMYVMYDTNNNKCNILQMPRDVFVGTEYATGGTGKINGLYRHAEDPDNRMAALANCFKEQLGLPVDFYITLDLDAMKALVDHMGSIEVYVPKDVQDPKNPDNIMKEGWRHFTGEEAEFFLRNRNYVDQDLTRLTMQQSFYSALFREFKQLSPTDLVMWMRILLYYVKVGNIDLMQVGGLAQKALSLEGKNIVFVRPPVVGSEFVMENGKKTDLVYLDPEGTAEILNQYFRPNGVEKSAEELDIQTLPVNKYGMSEAVVRTMAGIQEQEPGKAA